MTKMYSDYKAKFGDYPSLDVEPTMDQLAAISQLVKSNSLPYVDFSVFGPHGLRQLRRAVFTSYTLNAATGEWSKKETPGPDSIQAWERCFKTYRVSLLLLGVVDSERLESYMEFIKDLHSQFGHDCWGIIYRADVRMRTEFMDRIRRSLMRARSLDTPRRLLGQLSSPWPSARQSFGQRRSRPRPRFCWPATKACQPEKTPTRQTAAQSLAQRSARRARPSTAATTSSFLTKEGAYIHTAGRVLKSANSFKKDGAGMGSLSQSARPAGHIRAISAWDRTWPLRARRKDRGTDSIPQLDPTHLCHRPRSSPQPRSSLLRDLRFPGEGLKMLRPLRRRRGPSPDSQQRQCQMWNGRQSGQNHPMVRLRQGGQNHLMARLRPVG